MAKAYRLFEVRDRVGFPLTVRWRRGDSLDLALQRLHAIAVDVTAGRAPRDAMLPQFEGLDRWIPQPYRERPTEAIATGAITLHRLELSDVPVADRAAQGHLHRRWGLTSPLYGAGHAVLAHFEQRGIDLAQVHLHGRDIAGRDTPYFAGFALRYFPSIPVCLSHRHGVEWIDVIHPTRALPMVALQIRPARPDLLTYATWP